MSVILNTLDIAIPKKKPKDNKKIPKTSGLVNDRKNRIQKHKVRVVGIR